MENIYLYAFATFGHPNDFRQICFFPKERTQDIKIKLFDLTNAIRVFPGSKLYSIRKETSNGKKSISYAVYTFSKEKSSERDGTFIGSGIVYLNEIASESASIDKLNKFHDSLVEKNVRQDRLLITHPKDFEISKSVAQDFDKMNYNLKSFEEPSNFEASGSNLLVLSRLEPTILQQNFKNSLELLNNFDTLFFTDSKEIIEFARSRKIYKVVDEKGFSFETENFREEKKRKLEILAQELEKELKGLDEKKTESLNNLKESLAGNVKRHQENTGKIDELKQLIQSVEKKYQEYSNKIKVAIDYSEANKKIEEIKLFHSTNKSEFIRSVNQNTKANYLSDLKNFQARTSLSDRPHNNPEWLAKNESTEADLPKKKPNRFFRILSVFLFVLWVFTLAYFLSFGRAQEKIPEVEKETVSTKPIPATTSVKSIRLSPEPKYQLNKRDVLSIFNKLSPDSRIENVVTVIFENNPSDTKAHYQNQVKAYAERLVELNPGCFEQGKDGTFFFKRDTIRNIPSK